MQEEKDDAAMAIAPYTKQAIIVFPDRTIPLLVNAMGVQILVTAMNIGGCAALSIAEANLEGPPEIFMLDMDKVSILEIKKAPSEVIPMVPTHYAYPKPVK